MSVTRSSTRGSSKVTSHHCVPLANGPVRNAVRGSPSSADQGCAARRTGPSELVQASEEDASTDATPSSRATVRHRSSPSASSSW